MKKLLVAICAVLVSAVVFAQTINDPNAEVRSVGEFNKIDLSSAFDVFITQSSQSAVAVSAGDDATLRRIKVEVKNNTLYIGLDNKGLKWTKGSKKLKAYISFKQLEKITVSGACNVKFTDKVLVEKLSIDLSGASDLTGKLQVKELKVDLSGASDLKISGSATTGKIDASGASSLKGFDLVVENCKVSASGASDVKIGISKELSAYASGASDIRYTGEGVIKDINTSGAASIKKKG